MTRWNHLCRLTNKTGVRSLALTIGEGLSDNCLKKYLLDMNSVAFFYDIKARPDVANFTLNSDNNSSLPFPLNLNIVLRSLISAFLLLILVAGFKQRYVIFCYMKSSEFKLNPPNILFLLDQVNGLCLALIIVFRIIFNIAPTPLSDLLGSNVVCIVAELVSGIYISGVILWRCYIAIFKLMFVKAQNWIRDKANVLLAFVLLLGLVQIVFFRWVMVVADQDSYIKRSCYHRTASDIELLYHSLVKVFVC